MDQESQHNSKYPEYNRQASEEEAWTQWNKKLISEYDRIIEGLRPIIKKQYLIMMKIFCTTNDRIIQIKCQFIEWRKIITNYKSDRRLVCTLYKELKHRTSIKHIPEIKNEQIKIELIREFLKD